MSKTYRWYDGFGFSFYWFRHEYKSMREYLHRSIRHLNKIRLKRGVDVEKEDKTRGWKTW